MGSSPLARGLPRAQSQHSSLLRIIPARAGFTASPPTWPGTWTDHPRSRGVYDGGLSTHEAAAGSSPLARGLQPPPSRQGLGRWDHPRSRGVYVAFIASTTKSSGSSPLARGLLGTGSPTSKTRWIIPARAGFTRQQLDEGGRPWDHPRSRGVYALASS